MAIIDEIPKSRISIKYRTEINGEEVEQEIPFRLMVMGDLSKGTSEDRKVELDEREVRELGGTNLDSTMKDMKMELNMSVNNKINPEYSSEMDISLPIDSIKSFNPGVLVERVPQLKALLLLKQLVKELETNLDNNKQFRQKLGKILTNTEIFNQFKSNLPDNECYKLNSPDKTLSAEVIDT
jgi:type VI secretion system protein ImpB